MTTYITVAIPYVNASPHVGYAYELVEADIAARARRLTGEEVRFLAGTDDHSLKNVLAAAAAGVPTADLVAANGARFAALRGPLGLSFDDYIHTSSDPRHAPAVERIWRACAANGDLYRRHYEGDYCVGCEQFYEPSELVDGQCPDHGTLPDRVAEENWFFRLSAYQDHLDELISSRRLQVSPEPFRQEVLAFVRAGLHDISVSRSTDRARGWGVAVPDDPSQVVYVWFDALTNYLSALGFGDPHSRDVATWWTGADERIHVVGKGIVRFHAVYWPAFLASAGIDPPTRIQVHPYLTVGGAKLSKSSGNGVSPESVAAAYGTDALRWWFARDVAPVSDTDFTFERLVAVANADLANGLGNVTRRVLTLARRRGGVAPVADAAPLEIFDALGNFDFRAATGAAVAAIGALNREIEATKPWTLLDDADTELDALLARWTATLRSIARAVSPIVPDLAARLSRQLERGATDDGPLFQRL